MPITHVPNSWAVFHIIGANPRMKSEYNGSVYAVYAHTAIKSDVSVVPNHDRLPQIRFLLLRRSYYAGMHGIIILHMY